MTVERSKRRCFLTLTFIVKSVFVDSKSNGPYFIAFSSTFFSRLSIQGQLISTAQTCFAL